MKLDEWEIVLKIDVGDCVEPRRGRLGADIRGRSGKDRRGRLGVNIYVGDWGCS